MKTAIAALLLLAASPAWAAPTPQYCAAQEAVGTFDVTCYGADPAPGNNDTDAVFVGICHLMNTHQSIRKRTLLFPAGSYAINLPIGWDSYDTAADEIVYLGAGQSQSTIIKDTALAPYSGNWYIANTHWTHSLDPTACANGDNLHDFLVYHSPGSTRQFYAGRGAITMRGIGVVRATRIYPAVWSDDVAVYVDSSGKTTLDDAYFKNFYHVVRLGWGPSGTFTTSQPRPQVLDASHVTIEDAVTGINGDGTYTIRDSTFRRVNRVGTGQASAIYTKRVHGVTIERCTFEDFDGVPLLFDNDHASGSEPAFSWPNVDFNIRDNKFTNLRSDYLISVSLANPTKSFYVQRNIVDRAGAMVFGGAYVHRRVESNTLLNWSEYAQ